MISWDLPGRRFLDDLCLKVAVMDVMIRDVPEMLDWIQVSAWVCQAVALMTSSFRIC